MISQSVCPGSWRMVFLWLLSITILSTSAGVDGLLSVSYVHDGVKYEFGHAPKDYWDAETYCKSRGGDLARVTRELLPNGVSSSFTRGIVRADPDAACVWIRHEQGRTKEFVGWMDAVFSIFSPTNCPCVRHEQLKDSWEWIERRCSQHKPFVCEHEQVIRESSVETTELTTPQAVVTEESTTGIPHIVTVDEGRQPKTTTATPDKSDLRTSDAFTDNVTRSQDRTNRFGMMTVIPIESSLRLSTPDWIHNSQSAVGCSVRCMNTSPACEVFIYDRRLGKCMGYYKRSQVYDGSGEVDKGLVMFTMTVY